jgi:trk system potassium uptake protein TrkA
VYAIIGGGGKVGFYLGRELINQGHEVLIIEQLAERAELIANELGNVVLKGNADEAKTLADAGAERADVVIAVTGDDEDNLVICQVAKKRFGSKRTLARINEPRNESVFKLLGIDATINVTEVLLGVLEQQIPQSSLVPLLRLTGTGVEIVEARLTERSPAVGRALRTLDMPADSRIALVLRDGVAIFPTGDTVMAVGDDLVAMTRAEHEPKLRRILLADQN